MPRLIYFLLPLIFMSSVAWSAQSLTYHGRIVKADGSPLEAAIVNTRVQIRSPGAEDCLLFEESRNLDMTNSNGVYSLVLNDGSGTRTDLTGFPLSSLLSNRIGFALTNGECVSGATSYTPAAADRRKFIFLFKENAASIWEEAASDFISAAPVAMESVQVGGFSANQLCRVENAGVPQNVSALTSAQFTEFLALVNGTSTLYQAAGVLTDGSVTAAKLESATNGQLMIGNGTGFTKASLTAGSGITITPGAGSITIAATGSGSGTVTSVSSINADIAVSVASPAPVLTLNSATSGGASDASKIAKLDGSGLLAQAMLPVVSIAKGGTNSTTALTNNKVMISSGGAIVEGVASNTAKSNNTFVLRDGSGNIAGALGSFDQFALNGSVSGTLNIYPPSTFTSWNMTLPTSAGTNGQVLSTNGSGVTSWISALTATTGFSNGGNSFGGAATLGTNDANALNFETGGTTKMTILNNGNVGIGTTTPTSKLHVVGDIKVVGLFDLQGGTAANSDGGNTLIVGQHGGNDSLGGSVYIAAGDGASSYVGGDLILRAGGVTNGDPGSVSISANGGFVNINPTGGNVGIGTTSPLTGLDVSGGDILIDADKSLMGNVYYDGGWKYKGNGSGGALKFVEANNRMNFYVFPVNSSGAGADATPMSAMNILANGNVGIGTTAPAARLTVAGAIVSLTNPIVSGSSVNLSSGNTHTLQSVGGSAISLSNMVDGGSYTLIITDLTSRTYTFSGCTTSYFRPANSTTTVSTRTIYGIITVQNGANWDCYINWQSGYQ